MASALGLVAEAHIAKTDAALLAAVVAGQGALGFAYVRARTGRPVPLGIPIVFWTAETVAILLKGPPGPALAVVTVAALAIADREMRWLRALHPTAGILALVAAVAPWLIAIERATEGRFLTDALGHDLARKLVGAQELHGAPPLSYLLLALVTFWPGSLLLVPALVRAWRRHRMPPERFLLAWLVPSWVLLELVPTKLPHYVLPLYPALALLAAAALADSGRQPLSTWRAATGFPGAGSMGRGQPGAGGAADRFAAPLWRPDCRGRRARRRAAARARGCFAPLSPGARHDGGVDRGPVARLCDAGGAGRAAPARSAVAQPGSGRPRRARIRRRRGRRSFRSATASRAWFSCSAPICGSPRRAARPKPSSGVATPWSATATTRCFAGRLARAVCTRSRSAALPGLIIRTASGWC